MTQRPRMIERRFRVRVTYWQLRALYRRHRVTFRRTDQQLRIELEQTQQLHEERQSFARKLFGIQERSEDFIFLDESSF